jgi:hypothetical protein
MSKKWNKIDTWNKVIMVLTPIAGGEIVAFFNNITLPNWAHALVGISAAAVLYLKMFVKDEDRNGIVDWFDRNRKCEDKEFPKGKND